ncbi:TPA: helix-turn-helix transcriptional regulator, partial [Staphylococcus aureus]|nr:helix-turn-helix transcriptional regulator [Staphylococcus aureus]
ADVFLGTGIAKTTLYGLYHEKTKNPDTSTIMKICKYLEITPNEFFGIDNNGKET